MRGGTKAVVGTPSLGPWEAKDIEIKPPCQTDLWAQKPAGFPPLVVN